MKDSAAIPGRSWLQDAMKRGLVLAIIHIFVFVFVYYVIPNKLSGFSYAAFVIVLNLIYCLVSVKQLRVETGGYIEFGTVFKYVFVLLVASGIAQTVFNMIFLLVEPSFPDVMAQSQLDTTLYWAQRFGAPDATLEQIEQEFEPEEMTNRFTASGIAMGFALSVLFYALGAAIVGLIMRRRAPEQF